MKTMDHAAFSLLRISDDGSDVNAHDCVLRFLLYMTQQDSVNHTACGELPTA